MKFCHPQVVCRASDPDSKGQRVGFSSQLSGWMRQHPILAVILVAGLAVLINCYPVVFCNRSYVSPTCVVGLVYSWWPPLPGGDPGFYVSQHGSDTYATMIWSVPTGFVESRSLLDYGELPLWNRYGHVGDTLIGQNETMLGDPLQLIVILGHGSAGAWDVKFVVAKFLFCAGFGLLILRLLGNRPLSLMFTALAAYCGAFFFINNHPAFFVFCYAPWILLSALAWLDFGTGRNVRWLLAWLLVNFACFNAGHVELAVDLIGGLNLAALVYALTRPDRGASLARVLGRMALGTLLFIGLTAPMWMSFLVALNGSYSGHMQVRVTQLSLRNLPAVFDDLLYTLIQLMPNCAAVAPASSLLVLTGVLFSVMKWRQLKGEVFFWVNSGAIVLWGGFVFGWVPAAVLVTIPLLNRVEHIYTDFSYLLVIHLTIQCAYGFMALATERNLRRVAIDFLLVGLGLVAILLAFFLGNPHLPVPWNYFLCCAAGSLGAPLLFMYLKNARSRITAVGWAGIILLGFIPNFRFGLYCNGNENLLQLPGSRMVLNVPSRAVAKVQAENTDPFRMVGLDAIFWGDYSAVYGIEDIRSCAPLSSGRYIELIRQFPGMRISQDWDINVTDITAAQPLLNLLNVKYLLINPHAHVDMDQGVPFRIVGRSDFLILENLQAWPRAYFTDKIVPDTSLEGFIKQLGGRGKAPLATVSLDEIKDTPGLSPLVDSNTATIVPATHYQLRPNSTAFDIHAPSAGVVCLSEGQARDFSVTANHEPKQVLTVNRIFKGVYLDRPGDYHLEFTYRPRRWTLACVCFWLAAGGGSLLAAISAVRNRRERRVSSP